MVAFGKLALRERFAGRRCASVQMQKRQLIIDALDNRLLCSLFAGLLTWFLLYRFRTFERQMGSAKFAMFATLCGLWAVGWRALMLLGLPFLSGLASGPYELLFAMFALYYALIPRLHPNYFALWRLRFSDKSFTYLLGLQMFWNSGLRSALPALAGLLFGALYLADLCGLGSRLRYPGFCRRCCSRTVLSWWEAESPAERAARNQAAQQAREEAERRREQAEIATLMGQFNQLGGPAGAANGINAVRAAAAARRGGGAAAAGGAGGGNGGTAAIDPAALQNAMRQALAAAQQQQQQQGGAAGPDAPMPLPEADPDAVTRLMAMGFGREESVAALRATFNNEEAAANRLLEGTS
jgi:UBA/TS-N domain